MQRSIILLSYETYTHNSNCEYLKSFLLLTTLAFAVVRMKTELFILSCLLVSSCSATNTSSRKCENFKIANITSDPMLTAVILWPFVGITTCYCCCGYFSWCFCCILWYCKSSPNKRRAKRQITKGNVILRNFCINYHCS